MEQEISVIKYLVALRNCSKQSLPMSDSLVAYDLILFIAIHCGERQPLSVKQLFSSLPHSYSALREHYNRLLTDGYVVHLFSFQYSQNTNLRNQGSTCLTETTAIATVDKCIHFS